jgi:hypothetical protein
VHHVAPRRSICSAAWSAAGPSAALAVSLVLLGAVLGAPQTVHADDNGPEIQINPADPNDPKTKGDAPSIVATIIGGQNVPMDKFSIAANGNKTPVSLKATNLRPYTEGKETLAIALVINGQEIWIGNEDVEPEDAKKSPGVLKNLEAAIDKLELGKAGPPGSQGVVISYSTGADIKLPMGPLSAITGGALGGQKDYYGKIGTDMVQGITLGLAKLKEVSTARKALIVVGDGSDTNNDAAKGQLAELKKQASADHIQMFAIVYKSSVSPDNTVITTLIPGVKTVGSVDGIAAEMTSIIARMADRYYVTFPGYDPKVKAGLPWDGKEHELVIKIDQTELELQSVILQPMWSPPKEGGGFPWWLLIVIPLGLILLIVIAVKLFSAKPAPVAAPMPMMAAPVAAEAPPPPKPAGPMKTVMIGIGGDQDGFPVVGWIVPVNGPAAFQTYKLKQGQTKIGTASNSDVIVNDGFMSTDHCQIAMSPAGFVLLDNKSTNGVYVNDRKVERHELVDNDTFTVGKTNFKFKSIN